MTQCGLTGSDHQHHPNNWVRVFPRRQNVARHGVWRLAPFNLEEKAKLLHEGIFLPDALYCWCAPEHGGCTSWTRRKTYPEVVVPRWYYDLAFDLHRQGIPIGRRLLRDVRPLLERARTLAAFDPPGASTLLVTYLADPPAFDSHARSTSSPPPRVCGTDKRAA